MTREKTQIRQGMSCKFSPTSATSAPSLPCTSSMSQVAPPAVAAGALPACSTSSLAMSLSISMTTRQTGTRTGRVRRDPAMPVSHTSTAQPEGKG